MNSPDTRPRIVSTGGLPDWFVQRFEPRFQVEVFADPAEDEWLQVLDCRVVAIVSRGRTPILQRSLEKAPGLLLVAKTGAGLDQIDVETATEKGIPVIFTPDASSRSVAEHALTMTLALLRKLPTWEEAVRTGDWEVRYRLLCRDLSESSVGIIGYGRIGRQLRSLLQPFGCRVRVNDPYLDPENFRDHAVEFTDFNSLLRQSDAVSLHVPLTEETRHLVNRRSIRLFRRGAVLINTARGAVIEGLDLLLGALEEGLLSGVGLDVFPEEPPDRSHPLFRRSDVVATGHVAARGEAAQRRVLETVAREMTALLEGRLPGLENVANPKLFTTRS